MKTLFEMEDAYRSLSDREIIYKITNNDTSAQRYNEMMNRDEVVPLDELFAELTPGRKKVAMAAVELYKRVNAKKTISSKMMMSKDIYNCMRPLLGDLQHEEFWLIACSNSLSVIKKIRLSIGGIDGTFVDVRLLLKHLLLNNATNFAVVHNHPSGNEHPSSSDRSLTDQIISSAKLMNLKLIDHVIICKDSYYSFTDEGLI